MELRTARAHSAETVALLFSDLVGSTRLLSELGADGYGDLLARYRDLVEKAAVAEDGEIVDREGDGLFLIFPTAAGAIRAAATAQRALTEHSWPDGVEVAVRMGIHVGEVQHQEVGYVGIDVHHAARVGSAANGGQVLLTGRAWELARDSLEGELGALDLGEHQLRGIARATRLHQLTGPGLEADLPPPATESPRRDNLPTPLTNFVGRERELADVVERMSEGRLVTLTGVGGSGKTRLAIEAAREASTRFTDGVWLVELASITDPALVMTAIGDVWGLRPGEGASIGDVVVRYLRAKQVLLIVDNCEHLLDAASTAASTLLDACPHVSILATSRESLGVPGETIFRVPSLGLPDDDERLDGSEAVQLFLDRALAVRPDLAPTDDELRAIGRICRRIDGIPLGIELAAARLRSMSPDELATRLEESFRILAGSAKTRLPRQRTLAATLDWSYRLLDPDEQTLFRRVSVFTGGFTLDAAEAVCADGDGLEVLDLLDSLIDRSLVLPSYDADRGTRYRLLEPVRQYAQERLADSGGSTRLLVAHAEHFAGYVAEVSPRLRGPDHPAWARRLEDDNDNIRAAFNTLLETGDIDRYLDMTFDMHVHWMHTGRHLEGIDTALDGLEAAPETTEPERLIKAWWSAANLGAEITRPSSVEHAERGLGMARATGDPNAIGRMEMQLGAAIRHTSTDPSYLEHLREGRRLLDTNQEPLWWEPDWERGLLNFILAAYLPSDDERALEHYETAEAVFEELGDRAMLAATLIHSFGLRGDADDEWIKGNILRAIDIFETLDSPYWHGHGLMYLGVVLKLEGDITRAAEALTTAARRLEESGDLACWGVSSRLLVTVEPELGATGAARRRICAVIDSMPAFPMQEIAGPRTLDAAVEVLLASGQREPAAIALGKALSIELPPSVLPRVEQLEMVRDAVVDELGEDEAERLMAVGTELEIDEVLARARTWLSV